MRKDKIWERSEKWRLEISYSFISQQGNEVENVEQLFSFATGGTAKTAVWALQSWCPGLFPDQFWARQSCAAILRVAYVRHGRGEKDSSYNSEVLQGIGLVDQILETMVAQGYGRG